MKAASPISPSPTSTAPHAEQRHHFFISPSQSALSRTFCIDRSEPRSIVRHNKRTQAGERRTTANCVGENYGRTDCWLRAISYAAREPLFHVGAHYARPCRPAGWAVIACICPVALFLPAPAPLLFLLFQLSPISRPAPVRAAWLPFRSALCSLSHRCSPKLSPPIAGT